jgi:hypothetical protein
MVEPVSEAQPDALERVAQQLESMPQEDVLLVERVEQLATVAAPTIATVAAAAPTPAARPTAAAKTPLREDIEEALADGLQTIYAALTPAQQGVFRQHAERLAVMLEAMIASGKIDLKRVHERIAAWLKVIPKANAFFLLQEAKVKTDAIITLTRGRGELGAGG